MSQGPAEAGEEGGGDNEDEAQGAEVDLACYHHDDAEGHGGNYEDELYGRGFEAEEKGEAEDEG